MLLAAGIGERMLPITGAVPKPLIPVLGRPLAPQILSRLAAEGIDEAVINLHHLPQTLSEALGDGSTLGLRAIRYSMETERLLGTGGGLAHAAAHLRGAGTIVVRNSDFLSDISLAKAVASHVVSGCPATIVLSPHRAGYTSVALDDRSRVAEFGGASGRYLFTGYHLIEESVLDMITEDRPSDIVRDVHFGLAEQGRLNAYVHDGFWWEFGDPRGYLEGSMRLVALPAERRMQLGDFDAVRPTGRALAAIGAGAEVGGRGISLTGTLAIGMGVSVGEGAMLEDTVVMPEAWIGPGSSLRRCIVGPGTEIPAGFNASDSLIATDVDPHAKLAAGTGRIGGVLVRRFTAAS
jgi:mannose-1-phosphate guanylyltransferase/phosphomannomutase